jgi:diadenylate cyclase
MFFQQLISTIPDIVQIIILYFAIYAILRAARGSRFGQVLMGIVVLFSMMIALSYFFHFIVLAKIVNLLLGYFAISTVVLFQPEIRSGLAKLGALFPDPKKYSSSAKDPMHPDNITPMQFLRILIRLSKAKTGALIAFERSISLRNYQETGVTIDARISSELIMSIFHVPVPLHDGGMIIRDSRIAAAHCLFPVSRQSTLSVSGMRHRAAVGLSEETDAYVFAVSEETGAISVARHGSLRRYEDLSTSNLKQLIKTIENVIPETPLMPYEILIRKIQRKFFKHVKTDPEEESAKSKEIEKVKESENGHA